MGKPIKYIIQVLSVFMVFTGISKKAHAMEPHPLEAEKLQQRIVEVAFVANNFRRSATVSVSRAIDHYASAGVKSRWDHAVVSEFQWVENSWELFFSDAIPMVGRIGHEKAVVAFYSPWVDILFLTAWQGKEAKQRLTDFVVISGRTWRNEEVQSDEPKPRWQEETGDPTEALGSSYCDVRKTFDEEYDARATFSFLVPRFKNLKSPKEQRRAVALLQERQKYRITRLRELASPGKKSRLVGAKKLIDTALNLIHNGQREALDELVLGDLEPQALDIIFKSPREYLAGLSVSSIWTVAGGVDFAFVNSRFPDGVIILRIGFEDKKAFLETLVAFHLESLCISTSK